MYHKKLREFIAYEKDDLYRAYWNHCKYHMPILVLDCDDKFIGMIGEKDFKGGLLRSEELRYVSEITNYHCTTISDGQPYEEARNIYAVKNIKYLPVLDEEKNLIDVFTRERAFYRHYFDEGRLPRMYYASLVWAAASEAVKLGYSAISVIEFGVAGGNGLLNLQFHAREISKLLGISIEVWGFDTGEGLPDTESNYKDMQCYWKPAMFKMDHSKLVEKLDKKTQLVLGNIKETSKAFYEKYSPAPIGAIMVDVDVYTSTVPILEMIHTDFKNIMPRIYMYFDDLMPGYECVGESIAIKEFNKKYKGCISISPETREQGVETVPSGVVLRYAPNSKICHSFAHPLYNKFLCNSLETVYQPPIDEIGLPLFLNEIQL